MSSCYSGGEEVALYVQMGKVEREERTYGSWSWSTGADMAGWRNVRARAKAGRVLLRNIVCLDQG